MLPHKWCHFSTESYFSLSNHVESYGKRGQMEASVEPELADTKMELVQGPKYGAGAKEQVFVEERHHLESVSYSYATRSANDSSRALLLEPEEILLHLSPSIG